MAGSHEVRGSIPLGSTIFATTDAMHPSFFIVHALRPMTASGVKDMVEAADSRAEPQSVGENGAPMTIWQVWLRRLCLFVIVWAIAEVLLGAALWGAYLFARMVLDVEPSVLAEPVVGAMAMAGACLNLAIGFLGLRGARNPRKITLFFWITFVDAMLTAWALASSVSAGTCDLTSLVSGLFVIALAVCAWQVRGQTGYFDAHP